MKSKFAPLLFGSLILVLNCNLTAETTDSDGFNAGSNGMLTPNAGSVVVGSMNTITGWYNTSLNSAVFGQYNYFTETYNSNAVGSGNSASNSYDVSVIGSNNFSALNSSGLIAGSYNSVYATNSVTYNNIVLGAGNGLYLEYSNNNIVLGSGNSSSVESAYIFGYGNIGQTNTVTLGGFAQPENDAALIVGTATDASTRINGLVVYRNGEVSIPGNIKLGSSSGIYFGNTGAEMTANQNGAITFSSGIILNSGNINLGSNSGIYFGTNTAATITAAANGSAIFPSSATFSNGLALSAGTLSIASGTASSSSTTGALTVIGGIGIGKDSWISGVRIGKGGGNIASNTALGASALNTNLSGTNNTSVGAGSLSNSSSGSNNVAAGYDAAKFLANGTAALSNLSNSVFIGTNSKGSSSTSLQTNSIVIGNNAIGLGSNTTVIGNTSTTSTRIFGNLTAGTGAGSPVLTTANAQSQGFLTYWNASSYGFATLSDIQNQGFIQLDVNGNLAISSGTCYGYNSTAMTQGVTYSDYSTAMTQGVTNSNYSTAMSAGYAQGAYAVSLSGSTANGDYSIASGAGVTAQAYSSAAFGRYSQNLGDASNWIETDPLLQLGNGTDSYSLSNAITTLKNGQTTLTNKAWNQRDVANVLATADPDPNTPDDSDGNALVVEGHTLLKGKVVIEQPQGDISMGIYQ
jgi:hypothetical protein